MNRISLGAMIGFMSLGTAAMGDEITQVTTPIQNVTTIQTPTGTTKITTSSGRSMVTQSKDGTKIELDSDNSVYVVYPDGARVAAPNGLNTLISGETITVKDGKRIP